MSALYEVYAFVAFVAGLWIVGSCVGRLRFLKWGTHNGMQIAAYIVIGLGALGGLVFWIAEFMPLFGIGIGLQYFAGRDRWQFKAPEDTERGYVKPEQRVRGIPPVRSSDFGERTMP